MDLDLTPSEERFRQELASWLQPNLPEEYRASRLPVGSHVVVETARPLREQIEGVLGHLAEQS